MSETVRSAALSKREVQIAEVYLSGKSYRAVAEDLHISPSTVRTHISTIYRKLGVSNKMELLRELGGADTPTPSSGSTDLSDRPSVVVLPFDNRSGGLVEDFAVIGIVEGAIAALSRFRSLFVISHSSSFNYRDRSSNLNQVGADFGVRYVVTGWLACSGDRLRVSAEAVETGSSTQFWARQFDGIWPDVFDLQDEIARAIASSIAPEIELREMNRVRRRPVESLNAWELYCKAFIAFLRMDEEGSAVAKSLCQQAIALDEGFAAPRALLSRVYFYDIMSGRAEDRAEWLRQGLAHARAALNIDPRDETAHIVLGYNLIMEGDFDGGLAVVNRGLELNPNSSGLLNARALASMFAPGGRLQDAVADEQLAISLSPNDPLGWTFFATIGWSILADPACGTIEQSIEAFYRAGAMPSADWQVHVGMALAQAGAGRIDAARKAAELALVRNPALSKQFVASAFAPLLAKSPRLAHRLDEIEPLLSSE